MFSQTFMNSPLAWHICTKASQKGLKKIQYTSLKLLSNCKNNAYTFLQGTNGNYTVVTRTLRIIAIQIPKTLSNINPNFMKETFNFSPQDSQRKHDCFLSKHQTLAINVSFL